MAIVSLTNWDSKYLREVMARADEALDALNGAAYLREQTQAFQRVSLEEQLEWQIEANAAQLAANRRILAGAR